MPAAAKSCFINNRYRHFSFILWSRRMKNKMLASFVFCLGRLMQQVFEVTFLSCKKLYLFDLFLSFETHMHFGMNRSFITQCKWALPTDFKVANEFSVTFQKHLCGLKFVGQCIKMFLFEWSFLNFFH